jgi:crotonobetainyl-CoA:carnitine CoA-transferase CaiB-like acyl-CoA transferase
VSYDLLEDVKVVELSMYAFAPSASAVLADWGADVIKVVRPETADPMMGTPIAGLPKKDVGGVAFMWEILNRGKRCVAIDIATDDGRALLMELVARSDVFLTNLLPKARKKLRIDPDDMFQVNSTLVYGRATGHGSEGPEREAGGFDHTDFWARTGIGHAASMVSDEFVPQPGPAMGDLSAGAFLAGAIAAALVRRSKTNKGALVDVSLLSSGLWVASPAVVASQLYEVETIPRMRHAALPNPLVAAYNTRDGRQIYFAGIMTEGHFENFCDVIERPDLLADPKFATGRDRILNAAECIRVLDEVFAERDLSEWVPRFKNLTTPWTVVQTAYEAAQDAQTVANGFTVPFDENFSLVRSPAIFDNGHPELDRAPQHGEHTDEVLLELGHSWDEILLLKERGAVL